jgi:hypothetical protein
MSSRSNFFQTRYTPVLTEKKRKQVADKMAKAPDLVVFEKVSDDGNCSECGMELRKGSFLTMENGKPLCLACADLDHLVYPTRTHRL